MLRRVQRLFLVLLAVAAAGIWFLLLADVFNLQVMWK
jgi:hypothetical protein